MSHKKKKSKYVIHGKPAPVHRYCKVDARGVVFYVFEHTNPHYAENADIIESDTGEVGQQWDGGKFITYVESKGDRNIRRVEEIEHLRLTITQRRRDEALAGDETAKTFIANVLAQMAEIRKEFE